MQNRPVVPIDANICVADGPYFKVKLHSVPAVGDLISLFSHNDVRTNHPPTHHLEVVAIVHDIQDIDENVDRTLGGSHFVTVHAVPSSDKLLKTAELTDK